MALTKVAPALFGTGNNITSVTVGGSANTISLTFDGSGVITSATNNAVSVANTAITGNIISSQITSVANTQITGNIISSQISPSVTLTTPIISGNLNLDSAGTTGIRVPSANTIAFYGAGTEKVRIDSSGNMGIGITPPAWAGFKVLDIGSVTSLWAIGSGAGTSYYSNNLYYNGSARIYKNTGEATEYTQGGGTHQWYTAASGTAGDSVSLSERVRITSAGALLIGQTSVSFAGGLCLTKNAQDSIAIFENSTGTSGGQCIRGILGANNNNTSSYLFVGSAASNDQIYIFGSGNVVNRNNSYGALSDIKLKENVVDASPKLADVMQLKVRNFNFKTDPDSKQIGFIAQEFEEVFPSLIDNTTSPNDPDDVIKAIKTSVLVPILVKAIQELKAINDSQATSIATLTATTTSQSATITTLSSTITALTARVVALES